MRWFVKKVFDGGGKPKNQTKSKCSKHNSKTFFQKLERYLTPRCEDELLNSRGSVLIEFAVCMPVLIILLFYINDLMRIKRYYSQTEFVAQQIANMLQNVSQNRSSKRITKNDLGNIHILAWQTVCSGVSQFRINSIFPLHHKPITSIYLVKGESNGTASCVWRIWLSFFEKSSIRWTTATEDNPHSIIRFKKNASPSTIYSELKINPGEQKIIVETLLERENVAAYGSISDSAAMGMHFLSPAKVKDGTWSYFFPSAIIFSTKSGLFDETIPS